MAARWGFGATGVGMVPGRRMEGANARWDNASQA